MTNVKYGKTLMIRMIDPMKLAIILVHPLIVVPRALSQMSTSLVNLFHTSVNISLIFIQGVPGCPENDTAQNHGSKITKPVIKMTGGIKK